MHAATEVTLRAQNCALMPWTRCRSTEGLQGLLPQKPFHIPDCPATESQNAQTKRKKTPHTWTPNSFDSDCERDKGSDELGGAACAAKTLPDVLRAVEGKVRDIHMVLGSESGDTQRISRLLGGRVKRLRQHNRWNHKGSVWK